MGEQVYFYHGENEGTGAKTFYNVERGTWHNESDMYFLIGYNNTQRLKGLPTLLMDDYQLLKERVRLVTNLVDNELQQHPVAKINTGIKQQLAEIVDNLHVLQLTINDTIRDINE